MRSSTKWWLVSAGVLAVVVIAAGATLVVLKPWRPETGPTEQSFDLDAGVRVTIAVPFDWRGYGNASKGPSRSVDLIPTSIGTQQELATALEALRQGRSSEPVHTVVVTTSRDSDCERLDTGRYRIGAPSTGPDARIELTVTSANFRAGPGACVQLQGWDYDREAPLTEAGDLVRRLLDDGGFAAVVAR